MEMREISGGPDTDVTVDLCADGTIEVGVTDGAEGMYASLDEDGARALIEALELALRSRQASRSTT